MYLDYLLYKYDGLDFNEFISELPKSIKGDILMFQYAEAIENSIIFKDE